MKNIISASRRTDIPAFYSEWFIRRLTEGFVHVKNPYSGRVYHISLKSQDLHSIVFWSKDFSPLVKRLPEVERVTKNLFFHFTITGVPKDLEQNTPAPEAAIEDFLYLAGRYSPGNLVWRFDPIVLTDKIPFDHYMEEFARYAGMLKGAARECYISFAEPYKKVVKNFKKTGHNLIEVPIDVKKEYAERLASVAGGYGIKVSACCNDFLLSDKVGKASCINGEKLSRLFGDFEVDTEPNPTRKGCTCTKSIDIGSYDSCPHGCAYCYANNDQKKAEEFLKGHNPEWKGLGFEEDDLRLTF